MKKILLMLMSGFLANVLFCQTMDVVFTEEGVQAVIDNTVFVIEEPTLVSLTVSEPFSVRPREGGSSGELEVTEQELDMGANVGADASIGKNSKMLNIPLRFRWRRFNFGATVPYLYSKRYKFSMEEFETSGIGDISVNAGYSSVLKDIYYNTDFFVKLPTGDWENFEGDKFAPLGTGSMDFIFSGSVLKIIESSSVGASVFYKHNLPSDVLVKIATGSKQTDYDTVKFTITNGNVFIFGANYSYFLNRFKFSGRMTLFMTDEGNTDKDYKYSSSPENNTTTSASNFQDMTLLDLTPFASYSLSIFEFSTGLNIPVYTKTNENAKEFDRSIKFFFKFDYKIL